VSERRNANFFEVLISQIIENSEINIVFDKVLNVLVHAELFEPINNQLHPRQISGACRGERRRSSYFAFVFKDPPFDRSIIGIAPPHLPPPAKDHANEHKRLPR
jgi:hypothetical protein